MSAVLDLEIRRPGINKIIEELRKKYPRMTQSQLEARAKEIWHELNPK